MRNLREMICGRCGLAYKELAHVVADVAHGKCPRCSGRNDQQDESGTPAGKGDPGYSDLPKEAAS